MAIAEADIQAICEHIRRDGKFPGEYKDMDFMEIGIAHLAAIIDAAADANGVGSKYYEEMRQMAQALEQGARVYAEHVIPESYRAVRVGPTAVAFYPPASDPAGKVRVLAEVVE